MKRMIKISLLIVSLLIALPIFVLSLVPSPPLSFKPMGGLITQGVEIEKVDFLNRKATALRYKSRGIYDWSGIVKNILGIKGSEPNPIAVLDLNEFKNGTIEVGIAR